MIKQYSTNTNGNKIFSPTNSSSINSNNIISEDDQDMIIDQLENILSKLKLENAQFFENIDMLNDEYINNEDNNKVILHIIFTELKTNYKGVRQATYRVKQGKNEP